MKIKEGPHGSSFFTTRQTGLRPEAATGKKEYSPPVGSMKHAANRTRGKKLSQGRSQLAEREGFEPSNPFWGLRDFESRAFDHSAISPRGIVPSHRDGATPHFEQTRHPFGRKTFIDSFKALQHGYLLSDSNGQHVLLSPLYETPLRRGAAGGKPKLSFVEAKIALQTGWGALESFCFTFLPPVP